MTLIAYVPKKFKPSSRDIIDMANIIIEEFAAQGFDLTLRQLYYQFVARDLIPNRQKAYKRLGSIINDGRMAGLISWDSIVDRTRELRKDPHWDDVPDLVGSCAQQFRIDKWAGQDIRPEVWIEKDALIGVIQPVCDELQVPYLSCRGYTSQSEMWSASQRMTRRLRNHGQATIVLHLGDHDPSGVDMSRDVCDRLNLFMRKHVPGHLPPLNLVRLALNMDQVREYGPPPNPAKLTDSRAGAYVEEHGYESWELDALEPTLLSALIRDAVLEIRDDDKWDVLQARESVGRKQLSEAAEHWDEVDGLLCELREVDDDSD